MKLNIKALNQKSLVIDIEETKTVLDLKNELSLYPDIGVKPELQKLIYAGKILANEEKLSFYNIDVKKILVVMILKQPIVEPSKDTQMPHQKTEEEPAKSNEKPRETSEPSSSTSSTATGEVKNKTPTPEDESCFVKEKKWRIPPLDELRSDRRFPYIRNLINQNPEYLDAAIEKIGETTPGLQNLLTVHRQEILSKLREGSDGEEYDDDDLLDDVD